MLLDLKNFRLGKNLDCSNVDPLEVLKGIASWSQNIRCFRNSTKNNSHNEMKDTQDLEVFPLKKKRSTRNKNGIEQERRLCHWRQSYSREEDEQIIRYLLKNNNYKKAGTNTLWKKMELQEVLRDRSWQSMKNRLRIIRLHMERYDLCDEDIKKLGGKPAAGSSNSLKVTVENSRCCFCCPKVDDCELAKEDGNVRYSCHCSQQMKRQAVISVDNEALVQVKSIDCSQSQAKPSLKSFVKQYHTDKAESFSYANNTPCGDETEIESEPEHCSIDKSSPFHKTNRLFRVKNWPQPDRKRKLYILPSSDVNISIKSADISLLKNNSAHKKNSIPLRWPQIFTPINSAVFEKQMTENDTMAPESSNQETHDQNRCPDNSGSTVYGSFQSHGMENGSETISSTSMPSEEGNKATTVVHYPTIPKHMCHSSKTKDTLPDKGQNPLHMRNHSTPKKLFQIFNKRKSMTPVNNTVCIVECTNEKLEKNQLELQEGVVSPSFSISDTSSAFSLDMREDGSANHVNKCISDQMSSEYCKLQIKSNEAQQVSELETSNKQYSEREESPITQFTTAQDIRPVPEKDLSSSPTHHQEHSNSKQQSSTTSLPGGDFLVYGNKHCHHVSNYKNFYVNQWLDSVGNYYKNGNLTKLPSFSEKLNEVTSSGQDNHDSKNISCDNLNEETSCAATSINKSFCVHKAISRRDEQGIVESNHDREDYNSAVNNKYVSSNSSKISVLQDKSACIRGTSDRLDSEPSQTSSVEDSRKMTVIVTNVTESPDKNVIRERISEPSNNPSVTDSESDNVCHLQPYAERIASRDEQFLQISRVASLCNQEQCYEGSSDSGDIIMESQPTQVSNHVPIKQEKSISITDDNSLLESELSQGPNHMHGSFKQEISIAVEDEEFRYEGYSPPVDFVTHMSNDE